MSDKKQSKQWIENLQAMIVHGRSTKEICLELKLSGKPALQKEMIGHCIIAQAIPFELPETRSAREVIPVRSKGDFVVSKHHTSMMDWPEGTELKIESFNGSLVVFEKDNPPNFLEVKDKPAFDKFVNEQVEQETKETEK